MGLLWLQPVKQAVNGILDKGFHENQKRQWIDAVFSFPREDNVDHPLTVPDPPAPPRSHAPRALEAGQRALERCYECESNAPQTKAVSGFCL